MGKYDYPIKDLQYRLKIECNIKWGLQDQLNILRNCRFNPTKKLNEALKFSNKKIKQLKSAIKLLEENNG